MKAKSRILCLVVVFAKRLRDALILQESLLLPFAILRNFSRLLHKKLISQSRLPYFSLSFSSNHSFFFEESWLKIIIIKVIKERGIEYVPVMD